MKFQSNYLDPIGNKEKIKQVDSGKKLVRFKFTILKGKSCTSNP